MSKERLSSEMYRSINLEAVAVLDSRKVAGGSTHWLLSSVSLGALVWEKQYMFVVCKSCGLHCCLPPGTS